jgi:hypothetical protein
MAEKSQVIPGASLSAAVAGRPAEPIASPDSSRPALPPSSWLPLSSLLDLSRELSHLLVLVQPRPAFEAELYRHLVAEARRRQAVRMLSLGQNYGSVLPDGLTCTQEEPFGIMRPMQTGDEPSSRRWIIGAAAVGSASLLGLVVLVRSRRHRRVAW